MRTLNSRGSGESRARPFGLPTALVKVGAVGVARVGLVRKGEQSIGGQILRLVPK